MDTENNFHDGSERNQRNQTGRLSANFFAFIDDFVEDPGYFDYANFGPMSERVSSEGRISFGLFEKARYGSLGYLDGVRASFERVFHALTGFQDGALYFQPSTELALYQAMSRLEGTIMLSQSDGLPIFRAAVRVSSQQERLRLKWFAADHGRITPGAIRQSLTDEVSAVAFSLVHPITGHIADLEGIREVVGDRLLVVDATDAFGVLPVDFSIADVVAVSGHSWLRAGFGTGFLALSHRALSRMVGRTVQDFDSGLLSDDDLEEADGFMMVDDNPAALARLVVAGESLLDAGIEQVSEEISQNAAELVSIFQQYGFQTMPNTPARHMSGIVCVACGVDQISGMTAALHNHGISVTQFDNILRFSVHAGTRPESFDLLRHALGEV